MAQGIHETITQGRKEQENKTSQEKNTSTSDEGTRKHIQNKNHATSTDNKNAERKTQIRNIGRPRHSGNEQRQTVNQTDTTVDVIHSIRPIFQYVQNIVLIQQPIIQAYQDYRDTTILTTWGTDLIQASMIRRILQGDWINDKAVNAVTSILRL